MITDEEFKEALMYFSDADIKKLADYILSGRKFLAKDWTDGSGRRACFFGVLGDMNTYIAQERSDRLIRDTNSKFWGFEIFDYNDANVDNSVMYQSILNEAEKRGIIKKDLERVEEVVYP
jgi:hypothetical protein